VTHKSAVAICSKLGAFVLICFWLNAIWAGPAHEPQILFLHFKVKNNQVVLVSKTIRPGTLKHFREGTTDELHYELMSETGETLWTAAVPDPTAREIEYEDPPGSGKMTRKSVNLDEAEFTVRLPVVDSAHHIDFYKLENSSTDPKAEPRLVRKAFGRVLFP
jgi:hypothetical protein